MVSYNNVLGPFFLNVIWNIQSVASVDFSTILTEAVFNQIAPNAGSPYTYSGFVTAVNNWNAGHPSNTIFSGTETEQRHELAAFFGNTLHESDAFRATREYFMCPTASQYEENGLLYCLVPSTQFTYDYQQYCDSRNTNPASGGFEDGCNCALEQPDVNIGSTYVLANNLYFGRGAIQLSWNYNYIDASKEMTGSASTLCDNPELVATDEAYAWGTAIWFWTMNTGSVGKTCSAAVLTDGDFGGTVNTINSIECPASGAHVTSLAQRLNYYCAAATALAVDTLLTLNDCSGMQAAFNDCVDDSSCSDCAVWTSTLHPSTSPSISPTSQPSKGPTNSPNTSSPTSSPSQTPSSSPSTSPTKSPSISPTTLQPSKAPSASPSSSPSTSPTASPSSSPTGPQPSRSPTTAPSKSPNKAPTKSPSASPTVPQPSNSPSSSPSSKPTTASPTIASTPKPTKSPLPPGSGGYFPNWGNTPDICLLDDGSNTLPDGAPTYVTLQQCCDIHYGWNHDECTGESAGPTNEYYPNWGGTPHICLFDDGSNTLPDGAPTYATLQECCDMHYGWNRDECTGQSAGPTNEYYPNWGGTPHICLFDDGSNTLPDGAPTYATLQQCCDIHYGWNHEECTGGSV